MKSESTPKGTAPPPISGSAPLGAEPRSAAPSVPPPAANAGGTAAPAPGKTSTPATLDFALLRGALEEIPFGVATTRGDSILYANDALARIYKTPPGSLENKLVSQLFPPDVFDTIIERLSESRSYDGRVSTRTFDGRPIEAELHIEWYTSEAQGVGGFLVVRDVSTELGALGRLVNQLGAALFRIRIIDTTIEMVSPSILKLTGLDAATVVARPVLLTALISAEERERVLFLYRRMARGDLLEASAQVSLKRPDGAVRVLQIRATGRRDGAGVVRHIDGVVSDAAREPETPPDAGFEGRARQRAGLSPTSEPRADADPLKSASMELSQELLREGAQLLHTLNRELRGVRGALKAHAAAANGTTTPIPVVIGDAPEPEDTLSDLTSRIEAAAGVAAGAAALNRSVRRVLAGATTLGAPLSEVLDNVRATLSAVLGPADRALTVDAGDAANVVISEHVEELAAALVYLSLRAFRFAGSGSLRLTARRTDPIPDRPSAAMRGRHARPPTERVHVALEILGAAPADLADTAVEISSDVLRAVPRPAEADVAYQAAHTLIAAVGGAIESDDASFSSARTVIRLRS